MTLLALLPNKIIQTAKGPVTATGLDAKRAKSFNNALKMVAASVELTHQRLRTLENRTSMMAKAIMPVLDVLKGRIADTKILIRD